jgi:hypothetical protein
MSDAELRSRVALRGKGLRRLQRLTGVAAVGTAALAAAFTAVAARSFPGHAHTRTPVAKPAPRLVARTARAVPAPPALPSSSSAQAVTPLAPSAAPAPAPVQQQPAVVSGGS